MADAKISALTNLTAADPTNDMIPIVDVSDTPPASGNTKRISINNILSSSPTASGALTVTGLVTAGSATITGDLTVDTNTLKVTASTDTVCIGTTTTDAKFRILDASGNGVRIGFLPGTLNYNLYDATTHEFRAVNGSNSFGGINANGIGLGRIPAASGIGVAFLAAQSASSDANTLDDYEEGTWTGTLNGATTNPTIPVTATGRYTKVGRLVSLQISFNNVITTGASGDAYISGIPFTNTNITVHGSAASYLALTFSGNLGSEIDSGGINISLFDIRSNSAWTSAQHNAGTSRYINAEITYTV